MPEVGRVLPAQDLPLCLQSPPSPPGGGMEREGELAAADSPTTETLVPLLSCRNCLPPSTLQPARTLSDWCLATMTQQHWEAVT
jgi:hypothetical protein